MLRNSVSFLLLIDDFCVFCPPLQDSVAWTIKQIRESQLRSRWEKCDRSQRAFNRETSLLVCSMRVRVLT